MDALSLRPLTRDQAGAWAELLVAIAKADGDDEVYAPEDLLEDFDDPRHDFPHGSVGVYDGDALVGCGLLELRGLAAEVPHLRCDAGVHPDYRGRGIGARLIAWAQETASQVAERGLADQGRPGLPVTLNVSGLRTNAVALDLFAASGFEQVRWFHVMERPPAAPVPPAAPLDGLTIVGFNAERSEDARLVRNESFRDHWQSTEMSAEQWDRFNSGRAFSPAYSFLCYAGDEPVGMIISHEYEAINEHLGRRDLYIAMVGTRRAARGRGVATALLLRALDSSMADGFDSASLTVDADSPTGAVAIYERLAFAVTQTSVVHSKTLT